MPGEIRTSSSQNYSDCQYIQKESDLRRFSECIFVVLPSLMLFASSGIVYAQDIGETKWIKGPTFSAGANWDNTDVDEESWQIPEEGWIVVDYKIVETSNFGRTTVGVSYVSAPGRFVSMAEVQNRYETAIQTAFNYGAIGAKGDLEEERENAMRVVREYGNARNTIIVKAKATGSGNTIDRKGASIKGYVNVRLRYIGAAAAIDESIKRAVQVLNLRSIRYTLSNGLDITNEIVSPNKWRLTQRENGVIVLQYDQDEIGRFRDYVLLETLDKSSKSRIYPNGRVDSLARADVICWHNDNLRVHALTRLEVNGVPVDTRRNPHVSAKKVSVFRWEINADKREDLLEKVNNVEWMSRHGAENPSAGGHKLRELSREDDWVVLQYEDGRKLRVHMDGKKDIQEVGKTKWVENVRGDAVRLVFVD
jgi:hypothetical protein